MTNPFKVFAMLRKLDEENEIVRQENAQLDEENRILGAKLESLQEFRRGFEQFYRDVSTQNVMVKTYDGTEVIKCAVRIDDRTVNVPMEYLQEKMVRDLAEHIKPYLELDMVDDFVKGGKLLTGQVVLKTRR